MHELETCRAASGLTRALNLSPRAHDVNSWAEELGVADAASAERPRESTCRRRVERTMLNEPRRRQQMQLRAPHALRIVSAFALTGHATRVRATTCTNAKA